MGGTTAARPPLRSAFGGYLLLVLALGALCFGYAVSHLAASGVDAVPHLGPAFWLLTGLVVLGELRPLVTAGSYDPEGVNIATAFVFAILLQWGPWPAVVVQVLATGLGEASKRKEWWRTGFNMAQYGLCVFAAWSVMWVLGIGASVQERHAFEATDITWTAATWIVYFLVNNLIVSEVLALHSGTNLRSVFFEDFGYYAVTTFAVLVLSPIVVVVSLVAWQLLPLLLLPLLLVYKTASISLEKEHQSLHDELTGLPNRKRLVERLQEALDSARRDGTPVALCLIDLDRFKDVNDTLGHHTGDRLLEVASRRLRHAVRPTDVVARLGGDEFALLLEPVTGLDETVEIARRVRATLAEPYRLDEMALEIDASIGVALHPDHGNEVGRLFRRADVAMYRAKAERTGVAVYDERFDENSKDRLGLSADLRKALSGNVAGGALELHYQPKVHLRHRRVVGVEALVRWRHPERGLLLAGEFLDVAARTGLMRPLTEHVLDLALNQVADWQAAGIDLQVAVNVSVRDLADVRFAEGVATRLEALALSPDVLRLEVTEDALMVDGGGAPATLAALRARGVTIALDDFGTGYSSLSHLRRLPVSELKVDRSFVQRVQQTPGDSAVVRSIVELSHALGLEVVAEGVDTPEGLALLEVLGCDQAQGWLISPALPEPEATRWLTRYADGWTAPHVDGPAGIPAPGVAPPRADRGSEEVVRADLG